MAPADAEVLRGVVRLEVRGEGLANVELLPAGETLPKLGVFTISADRTTATLDFNTNTLPNGQLLARINAYDKPAGSADAREIAAMPVRRWELRNDPEPTVSQVPPASWMPQVLISFDKLPYVDPAPLYELKQLDDASFDNMLKNDWPTVEAIFRRYIPANVVLVPPTPLGFAGPWASCMSSHGLLACKEVLVYLPGLMTSKAP